MRLKLVVVSAFVIVSSLTNAQGYSENQVDSIVNVAFKATPHAGVAIAIVKDGKVIMEKGYGFSSLKEKTKVDEHTRFGIASNSKAFTSAALGVLVDQGKLSWKDKVVDYVPKFKMYDPYVTANFTIEDLLTHRSGLGLGAGDLMFFPDGADFTIDDVAQSFQHQKVVSDFRTKYDYDNLLYVIAGEVVHQVSGKTWPEFVEDELMKPLGMTESAGMIERLSDKKNIASSHGIIDEELQVIPTFQISEMGAAAGGIYASVHDLSKWMLMHLGNGVNESDTILNKATHDYMWKPHTNRYFRVDPGNEHGNHFGAYGLGWNLKDVKGKIVISHTGGLPGMLSHTILVPELDLGIVTLTNAAPGGYSFHTIPTMIVESFLGLPKNDLITPTVDYINSSIGEEDSIVRAVWETCKKVKNNSKDLSKYIGVYKDNWFGEVEISMKDNVLYFKSAHSPKLSGPMSYYKANTFAIKWPNREMECDAFASFVLDEEGNPTKFTMKGISPRIDFSYDFHDLNLVKID